MPHKPTVRELETCLREIVKNWAQFAHHLPGISSTDIDVIEKNKRDDVVEQKMALYKKWLEVYPNASWNDVVEALLKIEENTLAEQVRTKYLTNDIEISPSKEV